LYDSLQEQLGKQLTSRTRELVLGKAPAGARAHHSFHVLDVHSRVGEMPTSIATVNSCRISCGRVVSVDGGQLVVSREPLDLVDGKLVLARGRVERFTRQLEGRGFADAAQSGDWVSFHWVWVCEGIGDRQRQDLERYTRYHLAIANRTL